MPGKRRNHFYQPLRAWVVKRQLPLGLNQTQPLNCAIQLSFRRQETGPKGSDSSSRKNVLGLAAAKSIGVKNSVLPNVLQRISAYYNKTSEWIVTQRDSCEAISERR